jgi:hypothetical protein
MCGRFTYRLTWREIYEHYRLTAPDYDPTLIDRVTHS